MKLIIEKLLLGFIGAIYYITKGIFFTIGFILLLFYYIIVFVPSFVLYKVNKKYKYTNFIDYINSVVKVLLEL